MLSYLVLLLLFYCHYKILLLGFDRLMRRSHILYDLTQYI